jgi:hypothetical protein
LKLFSFPVGELSENILHKLFIGAILLDVRQRDKPNNKGDEMAKFFKDGRMIEQNFFITKEDARLKALALNWQCMYFDHNGDIEIIA